MSMGKRVLSASLLTLAVLGLSGCGPDYSRTDFSQKVMNKTEAQVKAALGTPGLVKDGVWYYFSETYNAENGNKNDYKTGVTFKKDGASGENKVSAVNFYETAGS